MTKEVKVGQCVVGGGAQISVQSMTNTDTHDASATLAQVKQLHASGADIVRIAVFDKECIAPLQQVLAGTPVPIVADIHFDHELALLSCESGVHKLRLNPGNIGGEANVARVAKAAAMHHIPIRIGVNSGSVEKDLLHRYGGPTPEAMVESALTHARMLEKNAFDDIIISIKASSPKDTVLANRLLRKQCDYPLHLGVTEAGLYEPAMIKTSIAIGSLLLDGIGDTIRVSLSDDPAKEPGAAIEILRALRLRAGVEVIACPTCGRTSINVMEIAQKVTDYTRGWKENMRIAVMGCVVNGPGEAKEADIGIAGGKSGSVLMQRGKEPRKIEGDPLEVLLHAIEAMRKEQK